MDLQLALAPRARVVRNGGNTSSIDATELVCGDVVLFCVGDRITADLRVVALGSGGAALDVGAFYPEEDGVLRALTLNATDGGIVDCMRASNVALAGMTVARGAGAGIVVKTGERTVVARVGRATLDAPTPFAAPGYSVALAKDVFQDLCARSIAVRNPAVMPVLSAFTSSSPAEGGRVFVWAALPSLGAASATAHVCAADAARIVFIGTVACLEALQRARAAGRAGMTTLTVESVADVAAELVSWMRVHSGSGAAIYVGGGGAEHLAALDVADVGVAAVEASQVERDAADVCLCSDRDALAGLFHASRSVGELVRQRQQSKPTCSVQ
jgi:hypothetical protein